MCLLYTATYPERTSALSCTVPTQGVLGLPIILSVGRRSDCNKCSMTSNTIGVRQNRQP
jgi:hypothetical protein